MGKYLFLFSISPVQSFISQARKTRDLYAGSRLLSEVIKGLLRELEYKNVKIVFPADIDADSLPNRFVLKIDANSDDEVLAMGKSLQMGFKRILENRFKEFWDKIKLQLSDENDENKDTYLAQLLNVFDTYWASVELGDNYRSSYLELEKIHAATKNIKRFKQLNNGNGEQGRKCSLCGERRAYFYGDYKLPAFTDKDLAVKILGSDILFVKNEVLCTVCAIKRFQGTGFPSVAEIALRARIPETEIQKMPYNAELFYEENLTEKYLEKNNIPVGKLPEIRRIRDKILEEKGISSSDLPKYYALIMFDGDNMGRLLAGEYLRDQGLIEEFHKELSKALSENAKKAEEVIEGNRYGKTVYAGGDDFLGFVSLSALMQTLKGLHKAFKELVNDRLQGYVRKKITMSAGIVIAHYKTPLKTVLDWARRMEKEAKGSGRDAFAIAVLKHSGEIHKTVWKWNDDEVSNIERLEKILEMLISKKFSTNFIQTLEKEFLKLTHTDNPSYDKQFDTELKRLIARSYMNNSNKKDKKKEQRESYELCNAFYIQIEKQPDDYFSLMRIVDFIARQLGGERWYGS